jgi:hypothetical protein
MNNTIEIKFRDHFRLNIPFKDKILFEAALNEKNIPFHIDDNPMAYTRYFLLDEDRQQIDAVLKEMGIIAGTDTIRMTDYGDSKKVHKVYLYVAIVVIALLVVVAGIMSLIH